MKNFILIKKILCVKIYFFTKSTKKNDFFWFIINNQFHIYYTVHNSLFRLNNILIFNSLNSSLTNFFILSFSLKQKLSENNFFFEFLNSNKTIFNNYLFCFDNILNFYNSGNKFNFHLKIKNFNTHTRLFNLNYLSNGVKKLNFLNNNEFCYSFLENYSHLWNHISFLKIKQNKLLLPSYYGSENIKINIMSSNHNFILLKSLNWDNFKFNICSDQKKIFICNVNKIIKISNLSSYNILWESGVLYFHTNLLKDFNFNIINNYNLNNFNKINLEFLNFLKNKNLKICSQDKFNLKFTICNDQKKIFIYNINKIIKISNLPSYNMLWETGVLYFNTNLLKNFNLNTVNSNYNLYNLNKINLEFLNFLTNKNSKINTQNKFNFCLSTRELNSIFLNLLNISNSWNVEQLNFYSTDWYGKSWADHSNFMFNFRSSNKIYFWLKLRPTLKIAISDIKEYATPISNATQKQTMCLYYYYTINNLPLPKITSKKTLLWDRVKNNTLQNNEIISNINAVNSMHNLHNYSSLTDYLIHQTFINFLYKKWNEKKMLDHLIRSINIWPYSFSFQFLRLNFTIWQLMPVHKMSYFSSFEKSVKWTRNKIRTFIYDPFFHWLHDLFYWKKKWDINIKKSLYWYYWLLNFYLILLSFSSLIKLWFSVFEPMVFRVFYFPSLVFNCYWISYRHKILSIVLDLSWRPGYIIKLIPYGFRVYNWYLESSDSEKNKVYFRISPIVYLYYYIDNFYSVYIEYIYSHLCLQFWLYFNSVSKHSLYFVKIFFSFLQFLFFFNYKILTFNKNYISEYILYTIWTFLYTPVYIIKFIILTKNIGGMFLHNCNLLLLASTIRFFIRKFIIKYNLSIVLYKNLSVYMFIVHDYIVNFVVTNLTWITIVSLSPIVIVISPYILEIEPWAYYFLEFISSYTRFYMENKIDLNIIQPLKLYNYSTNITQNDKPLTYSNLNEDINYSFIIIATLSVSCTLLYLLNFTSIYAF